MMSRCISSIGEYSEHEYAKKGPARERFTCSRCYELAEDALLTTFDAVEAQADRFAQWLADGARVANEAITQLARQNALLRNELEGIVTTLEQGVRVQYGTITEARALLTSVSGNGGA